MVWTEHGHQIHVHPVAAGAPIIDRTANVAVVDLTRDEALALIGEIAKAFGIEGVPSTASFPRVNLVIENPPGFYPKDRD